MCPIQKLQKLSKSDFSCTSFGITAERNFFATSHGKNLCDGVGGTVKHLAARASLQRSCFLRILVSTTAIIYSKLFSLTLRKFLMLMWSLDDVIWNMRSFLKTLGKLLLNFRFLMNSIENSSIRAFWCFELRALYKK